ncbi:MAG TPA: hypothetical protein VGB18_01340 [Candidatus Thermoplasmatota archaeon]
MRTGLTGLTIALTLIAAGLVPTGSSGPLGDPWMPFQPGDTIMEGTGCETSIGLSMIGPHFNDGVALRLWGDNVGPFAIKDVQEYSGVRVVGIDGFLMQGAPGSKSTGVWHAMSRCDSYASDTTSGKDFGMGWISAYIEPPEWGRDNIDHHFFVVDLSWSDATLVEQTLKSTSFGVELNVAHEATIGWPQPNIMHGRLHDSNHGLFEWQTPQAPALPREGETIRFWSLVHVSDAVPDSHFGLNTHGLRSGLTSAYNENRGNGEVMGEYYPVVFDVTHKGGEASVVRYPAESTGTFSHTEYCHHGHPEMEEEGRHGHSEGGGGCTDGPNKWAGTSDEMFTGGQTEAGLYWGGYDQTITLGPDYSDHVFDVTWVH